MLPHEGHTESNHSKQQTCQRCWQEGRHGHKCSACGETGTLVVASGRREEQLYMAGTIHLLVLGRIRLLQCPAHVLRPWTAAGAAGCFIASSNCQTIWQSCVCSSPCRAGHSPHEWPTYPGEARKGDAVLESSPCTEVLCPAACLLALTALAIVSEPHTL